MAGTIKLDGTTFLTKSGSTFTQTNTTLGSDVVFPAGHVLQVVQTVKTTITSRSNSNTSHDWEDISGMSCNITPKTGSKVLVQASINVAGQNGYSNTIRLVRGSTPICVATDAQSSQMAGTGFFRGNSDVETRPQSIVFLDTSSGGDGSTAITYKIQWDGENGGLMVLNKHYSDANTYPQARLASTIVLMEVAG